MSICVPENSAQNVAVTDAGAAAAVVSLTFVSITSDKSLRNKQKYIQFQGVICVCA